MKLKSFEQLEVVREAEHLKAMADASMTLTRLNDVARQIRRAGLWPHIGSAVQRRDHELRGVGTVAVWTTRDGSCSVAVSNGEYWFPLPNGKGDKRSVIELDHEGWVCRPGGQA